MNTNKSAIKIENLNKIYAGKNKNSPGFQALKNVNLDIPQGSIFGLLGPNGAGKSTMINIIAGLVVKSGGSVSIHDYDLDTQERLAKSSIGIVPQEISTDNFFTPYDALELQAGLFGIATNDRKTEELLEFVGLSDKARTYVRGLSGGMKRRLMIAKAMVHRPPILILDEPTAGVDIELRKQLWSNVRKLNEQGVTIILTTHYLEEAEVLCDIIAIINKGQIIKCEEKEDLLSMMSSKDLVISFKDTLGTLPKSLSNLGAHKKGHRSVAFRYNPQEHDAGEYIKAIYETGLEIADINTNNSSLEDVFLQLTKSA